MLYRITAVLGIAVLSLTAACDGNDDADGVATSTPLPPSATETASPTATTAPDLDIRALDLTEQPDLAGFLAASGGVVDPSAILYADLTEDGIDEAIVPVSSGGEGGDIAVYVYGFTDEGLSPLLQEGGRIRVSLDGNQLVVTTPEFAEGDPLCCPSQLLHTRYGWDGSALAVVDEVVEEAQ